MCKNLDMSVHSSILHNTPNVETVLKVHQLINGCTDVVQPHSRIVFSHEKAVLVGAAAGMDLEHAMLSETLVTRII